MNVQINVFKYHLITYMGDFDIALKLYFLRLFLCSFLLQPEPKISYNDVCLEINVPGRFCSS